jgi:lipoprotein-anchoring transpeptidase ErfK/SrfK
MKRLAVASVATVVAVVTSTAGAVYAYDASRTEVIAAGVRVAGIDVGGMRPDEARSTLLRRLVARLERPLRLESGGRAFVLSAKTADVRVHVARMVQAGLAESRRGNFVTRSFRDLTGGSVDARIPLEASYSRQAVKALVARVERAIERPSKNARVLPSATALATVHSENGLAVRVRLLVRRIASDLLSTSPDRRVEVPTRVVQPAVTTRELASRYEDFITISRPRFELRYFERLRLVKVYRISVGRIGYETPAGLYHIQNMATNPSWFVPNRPWAGDLAGQVIPPGPDNPIKARWMGIYDGAGIHGTDATWSIGRRASRGCIRMMIPDVVELYDRVGLETPVYIG